jgi:hypothetical protein
MNRIETARPSDIKAYNRRYVSETDFPNSTKVIRNQVRQMCLQMNQMGIPVIASSCDPNGSVGENFACALPGSDIDYWTVVVGESEAIIPAKKIIKSTIPKMIVDQNQTVRVYSVQDLQEVENCTYTEVDEAFYQGNETPVWAATAVQQITSGTIFYTDDSLKTQKILSDASLSRVVNTMPQIVPAPMHKKNTIRKQLQHVFENLSEREKYVLIRVQQLFTHGHPFNLGIRSAFATELKNLTGMGLFSETQTSQETHFDPLWIHLKNS